MRQALHPTTDTLAGGLPAASDLVASLCRRGAAILARLKARRDQAATRMSVKDLDAAQRADIGLAEEARQRLDVDGALMRRLMSMQ